MKSSPPRSVLIFAPSPFGGLAEHVHYQASELARRGFAVALLCHADFVKPAAATAYQQERRLFTRPGSRLAARLVRAGLGIANWYILAWRILGLRPSFVLLEANSEFHAVMWFLPHWLLSLAGVTYVTNFHDPVRGPERGLGRLIHAINIRLAYASLSGGLIHGPSPPRAYLPPRLVIREAPFGPFTDLLGKPQRLMCASGWGSRARRSWCSRSGTSPIARTSTWQSPRWPMCPRRSW